MRYNWNKDNKLTPTEKGALTRKLKQERDFKREYDKMTKFIDEHPHLQFKAWELYRFIDLPTKNTSQLILTLVKEKKLFEATGTPIKMLKERINDSCVFTAKKMIISAERPRLSDICYHLADPKSKLDYMEFVS